MKTYLQWLQDSDYDSNCPLCHEPFFIESTTGESSTTTTKQGRLTTIRLSCFGTLRIYQSILYLNHNRLVPLGMSRGRTWKERWWWAGTTVIII